ncbi:MAG: hypothetical protein HQL82_13565 [Magnetococcales bacterium]|nr:hypothetical protein [Magnetococcales bacterium]
MMPAPQRQLLLDFPLDPVFTHATLVVGAGNRLAVEAVRGWEADGGDPFASLTLCGPPGTGKTHLLQAALQRVAAHDPGPPGLYLDLAALTRRLQPDGGEPVAALGREGLLAGFLARCEGCRWAAVDDYHQLVAHPVLQEGVLFLFNRMKEDGGRLLFAGRRPPTELPELREDLRSRLLWGPVLTLEPPGDGELTAILAKMAGDRSVRISPELLKFLVRRLPRQVTDYAGALERLDRAALELKRPLTVPLAKEILGL